MGESSEIRIRSEIEADRNAVYTINAAAFPTAAEAKLVDRLRTNAQPVISLVAEDTTMKDEAVVGHILFSPVSLDSDPSLKIIGLAPMAVSPEQQRAGIGSALVNAGLQRCRAAGFGAVVVLGHAEYYPKFGFASSELFGIKSEYDVPSDVFMILELVGDYLRTQTGTIRYHPEFSRL